MIGNENLFPDKDDREKLFIQLYNKYFLTVCKYISKRGGDLEDAKDIFQDSIVIYYEKLLEGKNGSNIEKETYLVGIAKILWVKKRNLQNKQISLDDTSMDFTESQAPTTAIEKVIKFLENTGEKCMELLQGVYYNNMSMQQIAMKFGFSGERSATVQKYKCLEKVRNSIKKQSLVYEDFLE